jgi:hypothetical protein
MVSIAAKHLKLRQAQKKRRANTLQRSSSAAAEERGKISSVVTSISYSLTELAAGSPSGKKAK